MAASTATATTVAASHGRRADRGFSTDFTAGCWSVEEGCGGRERGRAPSESRSSSCFSR